MFKDRKFSIAATMLGLLMFCFLVAGCQKSSIAPVEQVGVPKVNGPSNPPFVNGPVTAPPSYKTATETDTMEYKVPDTMKKSE